MTKTWTAILVGVDVIQIEIEAVVGSGFSGLSILGLSSDISRDMRERIRAALEAIGIQIPAKRIVVNVTPPQILKLSRTPIEQIDFAVAAAIIFAMQKKIYKSEEKHVFLGVLSLGGELKPLIQPLLLQHLLLEKNIIIHGPLFDVISLYKKDNIFGYNTFHEWVTNCNNKELEININKNITNLKADNYEQRINNIIRIFYIFEKNHKLLVALLIAAVAKFHILLAGEPGVGKTFAFSKMSQLLPELNEVEAVQTKLIYNDINSNTSLQRPFRNPHHTTTAAALIGGASLRPAEVTLAHNGILFLDELAEFPRTSLEALREPLDSKNVCLSRAGGIVYYPADFQFCAATNPCPCGYLLSRKHSCRCYPAHIKKYQQKLSGPLLDRFHLQIWVEIDKIYTDPCTIAIENIIKNKLERKFAEKFIDLQNKIYYHDNFWHSMEHMTLPQFSKQLSIRGNEQIKKIFYIFKLLFSEYNETINEADEWLLSYRNIDSMMSKIEYF